MVDLVQYLRGVPLNCKQALNALQLHLILCVVVIRCTAGWWAHKREVRGEVPRDTAPGSCGSFAVSTPRYQVGLFIQDIAQNVANSGRLIPTGEAFIL